MRFFLFIALMFRKIRFNITCDIVPDAEMNPPPTRKLFPGYES